MTRSHDRMHSSVFTMSAALVVAAAFIGSGTSGSSAAEYPGVGTLGAGTALLSSSSTWERPSGAALPPDTAGKLRSQLNKYVAQKKIVGATAAVVTADGSWAGAAGRDGPRNVLRPDSAMEIASTTKSFVAAEILLLSSQGKVSLDAPVTDYVSLPFDAKGATVRQLATMTSGFPGLPEATIRAVVSADLTKRWDCEDIVALVDPDAPPVGTLGDGTQDKPAAYNGLNYYVLGMVIEKVTGEPLATVLRRDLLAPVGLTRIWTQTGSAPEKPSPPLAWPVDDKTFPVVDTSTGFLPSAAAATSSCGGAGMAADAASLANWGYLLFGGQVIAQSLVDIMTTPHYGDFNYGFGTMIADYDYGPPWGHAGNYVQYTSIVLVWPNPPTAVAVLVPMTGGPEQDVRGDLAFMLYQTVQSS